MSYLLNDELVWWWEHQIEMEVSERILVDFQKKLYKMLSSVGDRLEQLNQLKEK